MSKNKSIKRISDLATFQFVLDCLNNDRKNWKSYRNSFGYVEPGKPVIVIIEGCYFYDVYMGPREYRKHYRFYLPFANANKLSWALYHRDEKDPFLALIRYLRDEEDKFIKPV
jgi:hypothetical protein